MVWYPCQIVFPYNDHIPSGNCSYYLLIFLVQAIVKGERSEYAIFNYYGSVKMPFVFVILWALFYGHSINVPYPYVQLNNKDWEANQHIWMRWTKIPLHALHVASFAILILDICPRTHPTPFAINSNSAIPYFHFQILYFLQSPLHLSMPGISHTNVKLSAFISIRSTGLHV